MLCGFTCLVFNCVLHCKIDFFRIGLFVKIEEPAVLGINMFSAPSLTLKSSMITLLYWAVTQTVGFILFKVKPFWFGWRSVDIRPIDFALLAHLASCSFLIIMIIMPCSGMFRNVPGCSGMFHVPGFIDAPRELRSLEFFLKRFTL